MTPWTTGPSKFPAPRPFCRESISCAGPSVSTLVFCGCNYPNCPRTSIFQASERDFRIMAVVDAISGMAQSDIEGLERIGVNCATAEAICRRFENQPVDSMPDKGGAKP